MGDPLRLKDIYFERANFCDESVRRTKPVRSTDDRFRGSPEPLVFNKI